MQPTEMTSLIYPSTKWMNLYARLAFIHPEGSNKKNEETGVRVEPRKRVVPARLRQSGGSRTLDKKKRDIPNLRDVSTKRILSVFASLRYVLPAAISSDDRYASTYRRTLPQLPSRFPRESDADGSSISHRIPLRPFRLRVRLQR